MGHLFPALLHHGFNEASFSSLLWFIVGNVHLSRCPHLQSRWARSALFQSHCSRSFLIQNHWTGYLDGSGRSGRQSEAWKRISRNRRPLKLWFLQPEGSTKPRLLQEESGWTRVLPGGSTPRLLPEGSKPRLLPEGSTKPRILPEGSTKPRILPERSTEPRHLPERSTEPRHLPERSTEPRCLPEGSE